MQNKVLPHQLASGYNESELISILDLLASDALNLVLYRTSWRAVETVSGLCDMHDDNDDDNDDAVTAFADRQETENGKSRAGFGTGRFPPESASHQLRSVDLMRELSERLEHRRHQIQATDESSQAFPSRNVRVTSLNHSNSDDECDDYMKPSTCFCESHDYENYRDDDAGDDDGAESGTSDSDTKSHDYINVFTCRL